MKENKPFDMTALPRIDGGHYGRLFTLKSSLKSAYRQQKGMTGYGKRALRTVLLLFAAVTVFMSALFGSSIGRILDAENSYNHNTFYLYTENGDTDILAVALNNTDSGIDHYTIYPYHPSGDHTFNFRLAVFETFTQQGYITGIQSHGVVLDENMAAGHQLLAGSADYPSDEYILISERVADDIIETAGLGFVDEYSDLIGMTCNFYSIGGKPLRVGGVIKSGEHAIYLTEMAAAKYAMQSSGFVRAELASDFGIRLDPGEAVLAIPDSNSIDGTVPIGKKTNVRGISLNVTDILTGYAGYQDWVSVNADKLTREEYFSSVLPEGEDIAVFTDEHYFEYDAYYYDSIGDFLREKYIFDTYDFGLWLYVVKGVSEVSKLYISTEFNKAEQYKSLYGRYPTKTEYNDIYDSLPDINRSEIEEYNTLYYREFESTFKTSIYTPTCLVSDEDYIRLSRSIGETDTIFDSGYDYFIYTQVHSYDPALTEAFLNERFGDREIEYYKSVITPDDVLAMVISFEEEGLIGSLVALAVTLVIMSVCMYFIMRSSLMSRIKEIGIYRAIGVSKNNILLRFGAEASLLTATTVLLGYAMSSIFIRLLEHVSPNASEIFFYPTWYALIVLSVLCVLTVLCGILPVMNLLRKTPSEILAKYDV